MSGQGEERRASFAELVCSDETVRGAFARYLPVRSWWLMLLGLHRRPSRRVRTGVEERAITADGFRLYAMLYRGVAVGLLGLSAWCWAAWRGAAIGNAGIIAAFMGGVYLWVMSGLGLKGAAAFKKGLPGAGIELALFVVMIVVFVAGLAVAMSMRLHETAMMGPWASVLLCGVLGVIGGGSYCLELVYLYALGARGKA